MPLQSNRWLVYSILFAFFSLGNGSLSGSGCGHFSEEQVTQTPSQAKNNSIQMENSQYASSENFRAFLVFSPHLNLVPSTSTHFSTQDSLSNHLVNRVLASDSLFKEFNVFQD